MAADFDDLAADYEWLLPDDALTGGAVVDLVRAELGTPSADRQVLDCACGIGIDAVALADAGWAVVATDASPTMVRRTRGRADRAGVAVPTAVAGWHELPDRLPGRTFDLVLCLGNSLVHAGPRAAKAAALAGIRSVMRPGGVLVLDSRNWERLRQQPRPVAVPEQAVHREPYRCIPVRLWTIPDDWAAPHTVDMVFILERDGRLTFRHHRVTFHPAPVGEVRTLLAENGFRVVRDDHGPDRAWYTVTAVAV